MKSEKGVTIISLILYVILLTFVVAGMSAITSSFYSNVHEIEGDSKGAVAFSKINMIVLNDVKAEGVELNIDETSQYKISLDIGGETVIYRVQNDALYRNDVKICDKIKSATFIGEKTEYQSKITFDLTIDNYKKRTTYVLESRTTEDNSIPVS